MMNQGIKNTTIGSTAEPRYSRTQYLRFRLFSIVFLLLNLIIRDF